MESHLALNTAMLAEVHCSMPETAEDMPVQAPGRAKKRRRNVLIFCGVSLLNVGLLALILTQLLTPVPSRSVSDPLIGHPAPGFSLATLSPSSEKSPLSLADFKGTAIVLNFWASWCDPCKEEMPLLENNWKQLQAQGKNVVFLGIDFQESKTDAANFLKQQDVTYPTVLDASGSVAASYKIVSLPDTFFISSQGIVVSKVTQQLTAQALANNLRLLT
jgi:cytochrome c biogenesis protein CcmG/thiol:disulfide interchange protein DsbE